MTWHPEVITTHAAAVADRRSSSVAPLLGRAGERAALIEAVIRKNRDPQIRTVAEGMGVRVCAADSRPVAGADETGALTVRPMRTASGSVAHAESAGTSPTK